jgi:hypothetical protein
MAAPWHKTISTELTKITLDRQMQDILIAIESLERQIACLNVEGGQKDVDLEILLNDAFEDGYKQGYDDGVDDVYNDRAEITE